MIHRFRPHQECSKQSRGTTAVEMALVLPIALAFIFALIEISHLLCVRSALYATAERCARKASIEYSSGLEMRQSAHGIMRELVSVDNLDVRIQSSAELIQNGAVFNKGLLQDTDLAAMDAGNRFAVVLSIPYRSVTLIPMFGDQWTLDSLAIGTLQ